MDALDWYLLGVATLPVYTAFVIGYTKLLCWAFQKGRTS